MPIDPSLIAAGATVAVQGGNMIAQGKMNRKTRKFSESMYDRQVKDNMANWMKQNEYNSPKEQMKRLKEAGLNPHLVYGQGAVANNATTPKSGDVPGWSPDAPKADSGVIKDALANYFKVQAGPLEVDMLEKQLALTQAQTLAKIVEANQGQFDLGLKKDLRETTLEGKAADVSKTYSEIDKMEAEKGYTIAKMNKLLDQQDLTREKLVTEIGKMDVEVRHIEALIANARREGKLKDWEIKLNKLGINKSDGPVYRILQAIIMGNPGYDRSKDEYRRGFGGHDKK